MAFRRLLGFMLGCLGLADSPTQPSIAESTTETESTDSSKVSNASPRIRLSDGRYLAYRERGVPKNKSNYRVIVVHGFGSSKDMHFLVPQDVMDELGIYLLLFDRAGYGDSDPNPKRSLKSEASDIQELADQLMLGSKFFVIGVSVGSYPTWSCLTRIPQRLAGVALVVPFINYRWPSLPHHLIDNDYRKNLSRWTLLISRYAPALLHWYMTQKLFPSSSLLDRNPKFFSKKDMEVLKNSPGYQLLSRNKLKDRALFDSHRRDFIAAFGKWDFDPLCLSNPFPDNESLVHIWQGCEDKVVPVQIQRFVSEKLPWIHYHEVPDGGHLLVYDGAVCEAILRSLVLGEDPPLYKPNNATLSIRRDFIAAFGKWDFDPLCLSNPFPDNESLVHIWQGCEDKVVPVQIQRFVSEKLPWIHYHEVPDGGHLLVYDGAVCEAILRSLVLGEDPPLYKPNVDIQICT